MKKNKVLSLFIALIMVFACAFCGISEAAQVGTSNGTKAPAINKYSIGIPIPTYPINTEADILPIPDINNIKSSLLVIVGKYLLTSIGDSVCDKNMLATATKLSTLLVQNNFCIVPPINLTMKFITPR